MIPKICAVILFVYGLISITTLDFHVTLICFILGIWLFILGIRAENNLKPKQKPTAPPPTQPTPTAQPQHASGTNVPQLQSFPPMPQPKPKPLWETAGLSKPTRTLTIRVAGVTFGCKYSEEFSNRQDVLETVEDGDEVTFRQYSYKGRPAVALIHEPTDSDIGVVPSDLTEKVLDYMSQYDVVGLIKNSDWFIPRDDDDDDFDSLFNSDDDDEEEKPIYTCKVLLCAYKRNSEK